MPQFQEQRGRRQDAVGVHLCCCVLWLTLSNWWNRVCVCVCVCVWVGVCGGVCVCVCECVCVLSCNMGPSQHVWPCSCSRANFSPGCAYASVPLAWPMRDEERMREKEWPIFHSVFFSSILCTYLTFCLSLSLPVVCVFNTLFCVYGHVSWGSTIDPHRNILTVVTACLFVTFTRQKSLYMSFGVSLTLCTCLPSYLYYYIWPSSFTENQAIWVIF